jgi:GTP cyclohydrolase-4
VTRAMTDLALSDTTGSDDVQADRPESPLALSSVGVTGVEKVIHLGSEGAERPLFATVDCMIDLGPDQRGAHMSRFDEAIEAAVVAPAASLDGLAARIAARVRDLQGADRAEVQLRARYPELREGPASGATNEELRVVLAAAAASEAGTRRMIGVEAQGMTACPCGQAMSTAAARERLAEEGFDENEIERVLECVPVATHNQRGLGTLWIGLPSDAAEGAVGPEELLAIVEESMSSEIYELLKRPDEAYVVEKAHRRPRFVEDCVRESLRLAVERLGALGEEAFASARQENLETIHRHNVAAERGGLLGRLGRELAGESPPTRERGREPAPGPGQAAGPVPSTPGHWLRGV